VVEIPSGRTKTIGDVGRFPSTISATPDQSRVYVGETRLGNVFVIDTETDEVVHSFQSTREMTALVAADDWVYVTGPGPGTSGGMIAFERVGGEYVERWEQHMGFSKGLRIAAGRMFSVSRVEMESFSLEPPRSLEVHAFGSGRPQTLWTVKEHEGQLYVSGEEGLFRMSPETFEVEHLYAGRIRDVEIGPCPAAPATFPGDADCDGTLTAADVATTLSVLFDRPAQLDCDADCNGDAGLSAADVVCAVTTLAGGAPALVR
jgi:hypothetical protein